MEQLTCDVLVVGGGAAGLRAAISARERGARVLLASKMKPGKGTCSIVSGGVLAGSSSETLLHRHLRSTLTAGRSLNQGELVEVLVRNAPERLEELLSWGCIGELRKGYFFASGRPPQWGRELVRCLLQKAEGLGVEFQSGAIVARLDVKEGASTALVYSPARSRWLSIGAGATVLATGGACALYQRHDNPRNLLGDGQVLALEAGATLQDMEFVQFYPLVLSEPGLPSFLVPPRLADFGRLVNSAGENILDKYGITERPAAEKARDRLSRVLFVEANRLGHEVYVDLRGLTLEQWHSDPFSASTLPVLGDRYGARQRALRVTPAAHHFMGGVRINEQGATEARGLFAAGEVTGGLHGANRMGGNALTETQVFGAIAGAAAAGWAETSAAPPPTEWDKLFQKAASKTDDQHPEPTGEVLRKLGSMLWQDAGIVRTAEGLERALETLHRMPIPDFPLPTGIDPHRVQRLIQLRFALQSARLIVEAALRRKESRGAHYRLDFPEQDDAHWLGHQCVRLSKDHEPVWSFEKMA